MNTGTLYSLAISRINNIWMNNHSYSDLEFMNMLVDLPVEILRELFLSIDLRIGSFKPYSKWCYFDPQVGDCCKNINNLAKYTPCATKNSIQRSLSLLVSNLVLVEKLYRSPSTRTKLRDCLSINTEWADVVILHFILKYEKLSLLTEYLYDFVHFLLPLVDNSAALKPKYQLLRFLEERLDSYEELTRTNLLKIKYDVILSLIKKFF